MASVRKYWRLRPRADQYGSRKSSTNSSGLLCAYHRDSPLPLARRASRDDDSRESGIGLRCSRHRSPTSKWHWRLAHKPTVTPIDKRTPLLFEWQNFRSGRSASSRSNRHYHTPDLPPRCNSGKLLQKKKTLRRESASSPPSAGPTRRC